MAALMRPDITPKLRINSEIRVNTFDRDDPTKRNQAPGHGVLDLNLAAEEFLALRN